jgi:MrcB-like, N-terminal domain/Protein NO VEIN, C-terminal
MTSIASDLQKVLNVAPLYSQTATPAMRERDAVIADLKTELQNALVPFQKIPEIAALDLHVSAGGRQGMYAPVPWVRIYSPQHSPNATAGRYLVYLFAADGSRAYLSLNQGTSDPSGRYEPLSNRSLLLALAAEARSSLGDFIEDRTAAKAKISMDLAWSSVSVRRTRRIRNYEDANILAIQYESGSIPDDGILLDDLSGMLPLLACLYDVVNYPATASTHVSGTGGENGRVARTTISITQGRQIDAAVRSAVEHYAEDLTESHLRDLGWTTVRRVGTQNLGYDLECENSKGEHLHVEVKGTQGLGEEVIMTRNEVRHIRLESQCDADHALFVISQIKVQRNGDIKCTGGRINPVWSSAIESGKFSPTEYSYQVPPIE